MRKTTIIALVSTLSFASIARADETPLHASAEATNRGARDLRARETAAAERPAKAMVGTGIALAVAGLALTATGTTYSAVTFVAETDRSRDAAFRIAVPTMVVGAVASVVGFTLLSVGASRLRKSRDASRVALAPYGLVF